MTRICIGLGLYQGAAHLRDQLASIEAQDHRDWRLVVSDDGSQDQGPAMVEDFARRVGRSRVELVAGPRQGAAANFLSLIAHCRPGEHLAFCDQDDVWYPWKLSRAADALAATPGAGLYSARTTLCTEDLAVIGPSRAFALPFTLRNALVQAVTAGNTCLFSPAAVELVREAAPAARAAKIPSHDWWSYQMVTAAGLRVLRDDAQVLLYRQHRGNLMGRNDTARAMAARLTMLFDGNYGRWLAASADALGGARDLLTPDSVSLVETFSSALRLPGPAMLRSFRAMGLYRQTRTGTLALHLAALAGRLRRRED